MSLFMYMLRLFVYVSLLVCLCVCVCVCVSACRCVCMCVRLRGVAPGPGPLPPAGQLCVVPPPAHRGHRVPPHHAAELSAHVLEDHQAAGPLQEAGPLWGDSGSGRAGADGNCSPTRL